jgi:S1-C subfamily serine protease
VETKQRKPWRGTIVAVAVVLLFAVAGLAYYSSALATTRSSNSSQVSSFQQEVNNLEQANAALQSQLASQTSNLNSSSPGAVSLYITASKSVVTVEGDVLVTQNTFFGQVTSVATVQGSGFVAEYLNSSYVVTNDHVVSGVANITVTFSDGNSFPATVAGSDKYSDLAVLKVSAPASEFIPLSIVNSDQAAQVGETVYAIGSPYGLSGSMTVGIVSQVGRTITESSSTQISIADVLQFSAPINPGNSGGPLLDSSGGVIGITTAGVSSSSGLYFAIPSSTILREFGSLVTTGNYTAHPSLGISGADMTYQLAEKMGTNVTYGVLVQSVASGSAASKAGVKGGSSSAVVEGTTYRIGGDIIVSVNGSKVVDLDALASYLEQHAVAGETVQLGVIRSGTLTTVNVVLGSLSS